MATRNPLQNYNKTYALVIIHQRIISGFLLMIEGIFF